MSLSRLSGRVSVFLSLNKHYRYPLPTSRHGQLFDFGCRGFTSRCYLNKSTLDNCKGLSLFRGQNTAMSWQMLNLRHHYASQATIATEKKSKKMLYYLTGLVFAMVGASYAAVPLYRRFCQATGYGGTVQRRESVEEKIARHAKDGRVASREIAVQFNADVADGMPWKFIPTQREVKVKPGRAPLPFTLLKIEARILLQAAVYFNKIQCFCFEEQRLLPGEQIDMPVFFYIDPEFETDPKMDGINNIILSYTFFKVSDK